MYDWHEVQFFESADNVRDAVYAFSGRRLSATISRQIAVCIQQGRSFMTTALAAPVDIRPLLIYYGLLAFSKATVLARKQADISTLAQSHGVKDVSAGNSRVADLECQILATGSFQQFSDVVGKLGRVVYYDHEGMRQHLNKPFDSVLPLAQVRVGLKEILSRVPGLGELYRKTFSERENYIPIEFRKSYDNDGADIRIDDPEIFENRIGLIKIVERLRRDYTFLKNWRLASAERAWGNSVLIFSLSETDPNDEFDVAVLTEREGRFSANLPKPTRLPNLESVIQPFAGGLIHTGAYAIRPLDGQKLSEYSMLFLGTFLLSSLVRYRPQTWQHALSRASQAGEPADDRTLSLIYKFLDVTIDSMPQLAVQMFRVK